MTTGSKPQNGMFLAHISVIHYASTCPASFENASENRYTAKRISRDKTDIFPSTMKC